MKQFTQLLIPAVLLFTPLVAQQQNGALQTEGSVTSVTNDSLAGFNADEIKDFAKKHHLNEYETNLYMERSKRIYIAKKYNLHEHSHSVASSSTARSTAVPPCTNPDFESGDTTGWTGTIGDNDVASGNPLSNVINGFSMTTVNAPVSDCSARHTFMQAPNAWYDPLGGFPVIPPGGGQYVMRLGNTCADYMGETIEQTFTVDASNTNFTFRYAAVLNDGGHLPTEQPYIKIEMLDASGVPISDCVQYYDVAGSSSTDFFLCPSDPTSFYRPWTTVSYDLQNFLNQDLTIRFTVAGCTFGGHWGYAYFDCSCRSINDAVEARFCTNSTGAMLIASDGFASYQWFDPSGNPIPSSNNDSLYVSPVQAGDTFSVEMKAISDTTCNTILNVVIDLVDIQTSLSETDPSCAGGVDGSITANCPNCISPVQYSWNTGQTTQTINNLGAGVYFVEYTDSIGCTARDTAQLFDPGQQDSAGIVTQFCFGDPQITLTALPGQPGYQWYSGGNIIPGATSQTLIVPNPVLGAVYEVEYAVQPCPYRDQIILTYTPPANLFSPDVLTNIFTPNGDGNNDFFYPYFDASVAAQTANPTQPAYDFTELYIGTFEIRVYNRWGKEIFYSNDYNVGWDGSINGSKAGDGVYYWTAKYTTRCAAEPEVQTQNGFVHLLR